jgi:hypothetical protein
MSCAKATFATPKSNIVIMTIVMHTLNFIEVMVVIGFRFLLFAEKAAYSR